MDQLTGLHPDAVKTLQQWHQMLEHSDLSGLPDIISGNIVFRSPAVFTPFAGKPAFLTIIDSAIRIFEDFRYLRQFATPDGKSVVLEFDAHIAGTHLKGIDMIRFDDSGLVEEFEVMIRPANGLAELARRMGELAGPGLAKIRSSGS